MARKINAGAILADINSGMGRADLMRKYALSGLDLQKVLDQIRSEREHRARAIATDLMVGASDSVVMKRYQLSGTAFLRVRQELLERGLLTREDLKNGSSSSHDLVILDLRKEPRHLPVESVSVCDATARQDCAENTYVVHDISEHGLSIRGINAHVGDVRRIVVLGDELGEVDPFEFQAECRWSRRGASDEQAAAGFKIVGIRRQDSERLVDLIERFTLVA
jgi:hypothetical protein